MNAPANAPSDKTLLKRQTYFWAGVAVAGGVVALLVQIFVDNAAAGLATGAAATAFAAYVFLWSRIHPKIYLGKGLAFFALVLSAAVAYVSFSELAHSYIWNRTFQLTKRLEKFTEQDWSVSYPRLWAHEEQRVSGSVIHLFKPSKITPTMFFSITARPNVGTADLSLVVDAFFQNLPKDREIQVQEKERLTLPSGRPAYRLVYSEQSRRIPLKNEALFVLDGSRLFYLTVSAAPRWFDRQRPYLERLLGTLELPAR